MLETAGVKTYPDNYLRALILWVTKIHALINTFATYAVESG
jgi:hypothetical protein